MSEKSNKIRSSVFKKFSYNIHLSNQPVKNKSIVKNPILTHLNTSYRIQKMGRYKLYLEIRKLQNVHFLQISVSDIDKQTPPYKLDFLRKAH